MSNLKIIIFLPLLLLNNINFCQEIVEEDKTEEKPNKGLVIRLGEQDIIIPVTSK